MDLAEETKELYYSVPEEGSNIWFDAWVIPKGAKNKKAAMEFMNYICLPEIAVENMNKIGYTSAIGGDEVVDMINDYYYCEDGEYEVDLTYLFEGTVSDEYLTDGRLIIKTDTIGRQFSTQYPEYDIVNRCAIMKDFGDANEKVMAMWQEFKSEKIYYFGVVLLALGVIAGCAYWIYNYRQKRVRNNRLKQSKKNNSKGV